MMPNVTLKEFLRGESLDHVAGNGKKTQVTYVAGVGVYLDQKGVEEIADVKDDVGAARVYHSLTGRITSVKSDD